MLTVSIRRNFVAPLSKVISKTAKMGGTISNGTTVASRLKTRILPVDTEDLGHFKNPETLETWQLPPDNNKLAPLRDAAKLLKSTAVPVGFPTETVYGLGADATRSEAVKGIYSAKGRPSDNPLIVHICDLTMLRSLLSDPIPEIYQPLIKKFWPGPLTILLSNAEPSKLALEVTAGLSSFGARMPASPLALSLIHLAGVPLAAPSANASTKPSPTTAQHVLHDLDGKIEIILDGGPCQVGVESTVVDGLCDPPIILRPGGVSLEELRECQGWEKVVKGYKDVSEVGNSAPRAPGMKYKHYSPKAKVVLYETPSEELDVSQILKNSEECLEKAPSIGIVRTETWKSWAGLAAYRSGTDLELIPNVELGVEISAESAITGNDSLVMRQGSFWFNNEGTKARAANIIDIDLGKDTKDIAHGLFSALRELDQREVDVIYVEGIKDEGDIAAAVMNRLRKAATDIVKREDK